MRRARRVVLDRAGLRAVKNRKYLGERFTIETFVPAVVGVGLAGYVLFRCARGAWRIVQRAFVEFVSG